MLHINVQDHALQIVQKERIIRSVALSSVIGVHTTSDDSCLIQLDPSHPGYGIGPTDAPAMTKTLRLTASDAYDAETIAFLVRQMAYQRHALRSGMLCFHEGVLEKHGTLKWAERYMRLVKGFAVLYRKKSSPLPVNCISLHNATPKAKENDKCGIVIITMSRRFIFRARSEEVRNRWLAAFKAEREAPAELFRLFGMMSRSRSVTRASVSIQSPDKKDRKRMAQFATPTRSNALHRVVSSPPETDVWQSPAPPPPPPRRSSPPPPPPIDDTVRVAAPQRRASLIAAADGLSSGAAQQYGHHRQRSRQSFSPSPFMADPSPSTSILDNPLFATSATQRSSLMNVTLSADDLRQASATPSPPRSRGISKAESRRSSAMPGGRSILSYLLHPQDLRRGSLSVEPYHVQLEHVPNDIGFVSVDPSWSLYDVRLAMQRELTVLVPTVFAFVVDGEALAPCEEQARLAGGLRSKTLVLRTFTSESELERLDYKANKAAAVVAALQRSTSPSPRSPLSPRSVEHSPVLVANRLVQSPYAHLAPPPPSRPAPRKPNASPSLRPPVPNKQPPPPPPSSSVHGNATAPPVPPVVSSSSSSTSSSSSMNHSVSAIASNNSTKPSSLVARLATRFSGADSSKSEQAATHARRNLISGPSPKVHELRKRFLQGHNQHSTDSAASISNGMSQWHAPTQHAELPSTSVAAFPPATIPSRTVPEPTPPQTSYTPSPSTAAKSPPPKPSTSKSPVSSHVPDLANLLESKLSVFSFAQKSSTNHESQLGRADSKDDSTPTKISNFQAPRRRSISSKIGAFHSDLIDMELANQLYTNRQEPDTISTGSNSSGSSSTVQRTARQLVRARSRSVVLSRHGSATSVDDGEVVFTRESDKKAAEKLELAFKDPVEFFKFIRCDVSPHGIWLETHVPSAEAFLKTSEIGFAMRGARIKAMDKALQNYQQAVRSTVTLLEECRLLSVELVSSSAQSQISFSFPSFDTQVFDVGKFAIVDCKRFFHASGREQFTEDDWKGAMGSRSIPKELMQSSPDVTDLYDSGDIDEARHIAIESTTSLLHNLAISAYCRGHAYKLVSDSDFSWMTVMAFLDSDRNSQHMAAWHKRQYMYLPTTSSMMQLLQRGSVGDDVLVLDCIRFLIFLRIALRHRLTYLQPLSIAIMEWQLKNSDDSARHESVSRLDNQVHVEKQLIARAVAKLPPLRLLNSIATHTERRHSVSVLRDFIGQRRSINDILESNAAREHISDPAATRCSAAAAKVKLEAMLAKILKPPTT
jgi:PH domain